jgi:hypothetical protein
MTGGLIDAEQCGADLSNAGGLNVSHLYVKQQQQWSTTWFKLAHTVQLPDTIKNLEVRCLRVMRFVWPPWAWAR